MKVLFGIKGQKPVDLEKDIKLDFNSIKQEKDFENFTQETFSTISADLVSEISKKISGLGNGSESYMTIDKVTSTSPVRNFEELQESFVSDFELFKDIYTGQMKGFGPKK